MKKLLCSILILSVLLGLTACGKKEVDVDAVIQAIQAEKAEKEFEESYTQTQESSTLPYGPITYTETTTTTEPELSEETLEVHTLPINEYLHNTGKTPLLFYYGFVYDKNDVPEEFWLFLNGKVKILPNILNYTMADITKMDDETLISSTETALEVEFQSYIDRYAEMVEDFLSSSSNLDLFDYYRTDDLFKLTNDDNLYHLNTGYGGFVLNDQVDEIEASINTIVEQNGMENDWSYSKYLMFHPTQYHMPDYIDYVYVVETDHTGNNIQNFTLVVDNECYFTGNMELLVREGMVIGRSPLKYQFDIPGGEAYVYSCHTSYDNAFAKQYRQETDPFFFDFNSKLARSITFGHAPSAADEYTFDHSFYFLDYDRSTTFLDTTFYVSDRFLTKDAAFETVSPDSRIDMTQYSNYGPVDYSQDGILYLIDPTPTEICQYFADHK